MIKHINKLYVRIIIAIVFGLLAASAITTMQGPCTKTVPGESVANCVEFSKAVTHPADLLDNKQDSLLNFSRTFAIVAAACFALLSLYRWHQKQKQS